MRDKAPAISDIVAYAGMPSAPRRRSACDVCHRMKVRCSGTSPCDTCVEAGRSCLYSISGRLGRPPGAKNKRSALSPRRVSRPVASRAGRSTSVPTRSPRRSSGVEETTTGQHCWVLDRSASEEQQSHIEAQPPSNQNKSGQISSSETSTPGSQRIGGEIGGTNQIDMRDDGVLPYARRYGAKYNFSATVGAWDWSPSLPEAVISVGDPGVADGHD